MDGWMEGSETNQRTNEKRLASSADWEKGIKQAARWPAGIHSD